MTQRPGFKTSEWIVTLLTIIGATATAAQGSLPPKWSAIIATIATVSYTISRGLAKTETRP